MKEEKIREQVKLWVKNNILLSFSKKRLLEYIDALTDLAFTISNHPEDRKGMSEIDKEVDVSSYKHDLDYLEDIRSKKDKLENALKRGLIKQQKAGGKIEELKFIGNLIESTLEKPKWNPSEFQIIRKPLAKVISMMRRSRIPSNKQVGLMTNFFIEFGYVSYFKKLEEYVGWNDIPKDYMKNGKKYWILSNEHLWRKMDGYFHSIGDYSMT